VCCKEAAQILPMVCSFFPRYGRGFRSRNGLVEVPFDTSPQVAQEQQLSSPDDGRKNQTI
jgi:hypothetical protein